MINASLIPDLDMPLIESNCFFRIDEGKTVTQVIIVQQYSLLIDLEQAMFNLSALFGLRYPNEQDEISMTVIFGQGEGSPDYALSAKS